MTGGFDLIVQGHCASLAEYMDNMDLIRPQLAEFVTRLETNFVSKRLVRSPEVDQPVAMWLPCEGGRRRVETDQITKIVAEGDYMRIHVGDWNCLLHTTMQRLCEQLKCQKFIRLNRSTLVRIEFIDRLLHNQRCWKARLRDGSLVRVAKSRVKEALRITSGEIPQPQAGHAETSETFEMQS